MAQWVETHVKAGNQRLTPVTHRVEGEKLSSEVYMLLHTRTHVQNKSRVANKT